MKQSRIKRGISFKLILLVSASVALIFAMILAYIYRVSHDTISDNLKENSRLLTLATVNEVEKILTAVQKIPDNLAKVIEGGNDQPEQLNRLLRLVVENNSEIFGAGIAFEPDYGGPSKEYSTIYYYKQGGKVVNGNIGHNEYDDHSMDWYAIPKELGKPLWSEPYFDEGGGNITMSTYSVPVYYTVGDEKKLIGIIFADLSLEWLHNIVSQIKVYESGYAFMISRTGSIVTHPLKEVITNETVFSIAEESHSKELREIGINMIEGESSFAEFEYRNVATGKLSWISYGPVKVNGWSLGLVYPVDELTASLNTLFREVLLLSIGGGIILLIVISFISRSITNPLRKLALATEKMGGGNFDAPLPEIRQKDEIGDLTRTFAEMQEALRQTISKLTDANSEIEEYSKNLESKVEERTKELTEKNEALDKSVENVRTLSEIGKEITSSLNLESIFTTVYERVNSLLDANSFLIMIINQKEHTLDCKLAIEKNERLPEFSFSLDDKNRYGVWCVDHRQPVFINDVDVDYAKYIEHRVKPKAGDYMSSLLYLPLIIGDRLIGVISAQSLKKFAYTENHLDILGNIANYTAIALDHAYAYESINRANTDLKEAQTQLVQAEKMASLGQLTAGIAHEIKNPLNFINNFSEISVDLSRELLEELEQNKDKIDEKSFSYIKEILADIDHNVKKINEHGKRADSIVKGMLLHSRGKSGERQMTNLNDLLHEYLNLAYHGFRAQDSTFNIKMETEFDKDIGSISVVPQNLSRVFLNIFNNGCYSVHEKKKERRDGFDPILRVATHNLGDKVEIRIRDNGKGIPQDILDKIFNPFFTTKPTGKGTGLGLSLSYDIIVQEHKGELRVESEPGEFAEFIITIPKNL